MSRRARASTADRDEDASGERVTGNRGRAVARVAFLKGVRRVEAHRLAPYRHVSLRAPFLDACEVLAR